MLGTMLRFVSVNYNSLCTEAKWQLRGGGLLSSVRRAYAERSTLFPTAEFVFI
jgi:hypothetical protein